MYFLMEETVFLYFMMIMEDASNGDLLRDNHPLKQRLNFGNHGSPPSCIFHNDS